MKIVRALLIISVFLIAIIVLLIIKNNSAVDKILHDVVFIETIDGWNKCSLDNCYIDEDSSAIVFDRKDESILTSFSVSPGYEFDHVILSWNIKYNENPGRFDFDLEVSEDSLRWYRFDYLTWGDSAFENKTAVKSIDGAGRINVDVLKLEKPMRFARVIVTRFSADKTERVYLRRLALDFSNDNPRWKNYRKYHIKDDEQYYGTVKLSVPYITQRSLAANKEGGACSPTSVSMVLNYHIPGVDPEVFAWKAYDHENEIFGNWPYNIQAAFSEGMSKAWAARHCGFDEIYYEVSTGKPVVISIAYGYDELPNSPIHGAEAGHLVVVVGFDGPDSVICNDPAGHGVDDGIVKYPRKELEQAWIGHTGVAYHLWP